MFSISSYTTVTWQSEMAIWQLKLSFLPEPAIRERFGTVSISLLQSQMDGEEWWANHQPPQELAQWISDILPEATSWSSSVRIWGQEEQRGNSVSVFYTDESLAIIQWIEARIDVRVIDRVFVSSLATLAARLNCYFATVDCHMVKPELNDIMNALEHSTAQKFVSDPEATLRSLKPQPGVTQDVNFRTDDTG